MQAFANAERVLASVIGLGLYSLNEVRMFHGLPRTADPGSGQTHALSLQLMDASEQVYASVADLALRWGLAGLTLGLCLWALAETLPQRAPAKR
ncbi:MAG: hypothetical protein AB7O98_09505 [Hyphomonadaceae bacterium]